MEEYCDRKPTRLRRFDYSQNRVYFLTICTAEKKCILSHIMPNSQIRYDSQLNNVDNMQLSRDGFMPTVQLTEIGMIVNKYIMSINNAEGVIVDKYVIMPNHIHLILAVKNEAYQSYVDNGINNSISAIKRSNDMIPHIVSTFKRFCNKEIGENIFQRSYYDHVVRNNEDYEEIVRYIIHNPRRWYLKYRIPKR